jgi:hypothetical protein
MQCSVSAVIDRIGVPSEGGSAADAVSAEPQILRAFGMSANVPGFPNEITGMAANHGGTNSHGVTS